MKKAIFVSAIIITLVTGITYMGCQSPTEKAAKAEDKVMDAKQDLKEAEKDAATAANKAASAEEWKAFKAETEVKIKNNEVVIAELKAKMKKAGKTLDAVYAKSIESLEQRNKDLKAKLDGYENNQSDWESFKREFNHDMEELGKALKDLTVNNSK